MIFVSVAILSTLLTLVYTFLVGIRIFFGPLKMNSEHIKDPPLTMSLPILALAAMAIVLGLYPAPVLNFFSMVVKGV
ncbi:MAG: hypothetical protein HQM13_20135 [SAR324 cluster bacterium]|nr:hypothetical protein [SAR324 cluster bacterium]